MIQTLVLLAAFVGQTDGLSILDFHSQTCPPCRTMRPLMADLRKAGYPVKTIDIQADEAAAAKYSVNAVPTVIIVDRDGAELKRFMGVQDPNDIAKAFNRELKAKPKAKAEPEQPYAPDLPHHPSIPKPWETVDSRIRVIGSRSTGFGSGTIISASTGIRSDRRDVCPYLFHLHDRKEAKPSENPKKIAVDTFDGVLKGNNPAKVTY